MMSDTPIIDQLAHTGAGAAFLLPAALWPHPLTFALAGMAYGVLREITEISNYVTVEHVLEGLSNGRSWKDIAFWTLGGFLAGLGTL